MTGPMLLLFGLAVGVAFVAPEARAQTMSLAEFDAQRDVILLGLSEGQRYADLASEEKDAVLAALDRIQEAIGTADSIEDLPLEVRVSIYNDQERINTILTVAQDGDREICLHHRTVYSRLKTSECRTVAEWEQRRRNALAHARVMSMRSLW